MEHSIRRLMIIHKKSKSPSFLILDCDFLVFSSSGSAQKRSVNGILFKDNTTTPTTRRLLPPPPFCSSFSPLLSFSFFSLFPRLSLSRIYPFVSLFFFFFYFFSLPSLFPLSSLSFPSLFCSSLVQSHLVVVVLAIMFLASRDSRPQF